MKLPHRFGRYTLLERIARGGTAEVFRARFESSDGFVKTVAIKRLLPNWCGNAELRTLLIDEARVLTHLQHQAIVQVYELGRDASVPFIAMEYVDGIDAGQLLRFCLRDEEPLPMAQALFITAQVLVALEFAHRSVGADGTPLHIVHRDISPSNILISVNGEVKVTDFGIAKGGHRTHVTAMGAPRGKYAYMAPEQARGESVDCRADLFACGIMLFELLTASRLFDAPTDIEVLERVRSVDLPQERMAHLPPELRAILLLALAADSDVRYQHASEMLADVRQAMQILGAMSTSLEMAGLLHERFACAPRATLGTEAEGDGTRVMPVEVGQRLRKWSWHRLRLMGAAVILLLLAAVPPVGSREVSVEVPPSSISQEVAAASAPSPTVPVSGRIVIDSTPTGATGTLFFGGERRAITTPFVQDAIDLGDGIDGRVTLSLPGHVPATKTFRLTPESPAMVANVSLARRGHARLSVTARPWGMVDVAGAARGREAPLHLTLAPGAHEVRVHHPPTGRSVSRRLQLAAGTNTRCRADFVDEARLVCQQ